MIKYRLFLQWWFVFTLVLLGTVIAIGLGAFQKIYAYDATKLSFLILAIFVVMSLCCGGVTYFISSKTSKGITVTDKDYNRLSTWEESGWFASDVCLTLGMIGTVVGFIMMLMGGFENIDATNTDTLQKAIGQMATGMSTALYTTLVGLVASTLLKLQFFNLSRGLHHIRPAENIGMEA